MRHMLRENAERRVTACLPAGKAAGLPHDEAVEAAGGWMAACGAVLADSGLTHGEARALLALLLLDGPHVKRRLGRGRVATAIGRRADSFVGTLLKRLRAKGYLTASPRGGWLYRLPTCAAGQSRNQSKKTGRIEGRGPMDAERREAKGIPIISTELVGIASALPVAAVRADHGYRPTCPAGRQGDSELVKRLGWILGSGCLKRATWRVIDRLAIGRAGMAGERQAVTARLLRWARAAAAHRQTDGASTPTASAADPGAAFVRRVAGLPGMTGRAGDVLGLLGDHLETQAAGAARVRRVPSMVEAWPGRAAEQTGADAAIVRLAEIERHAAP